MCVVAQHMHLNCAICDCACCHFYCNNDSVSKLCFSVLYKEANVFDGTHHLTLYTVENEKVGSSEIRMSLGYDFTLKQYAITVNVKCTARVNDKHQTRSLRAVVDGEDFTTISELFVLTERNEEEVNLHAW